MEIIVPVFIVWSLLVFWLVLLTNKLLKLEAIVIPRYPTAPEFTKPVDNNRYVPMLRRGSTGVLNDRQDIYGNIWEWHLYDPMLLTPCTGCGEIIKAWGWQHQTAPMNYHNECVELIDA